jgi:hypothetical protein
MSEGEDEDVTRPIIKCLPGSSIPSAANENLSIDVIDKGKRKAKRCSA